MTERQGGCRRCDLNRCVRVSLIPRDGLIDVNGRRGRPWPSLSHRLDRHGAPWAAVAARPDHGHGGSLAIVGKGWLHGRLDASSRHINHARRQWAELPSFRWRDVTVCGHVSPERQAALIFIAACSCWLAAVLLFAVDSARQLSTTLERRRLRSTETCVKVRLLRC